MRFLAVSGRPWSLLARKGLKNLLVHLFVLILRILLGQPSIAQSIALYSRYDVKVDVLDHLAGTSAVVLQHVVTLGARCSHYRRG